MAKKPKDMVKKNTGSAALGFEATLWAMADKQRGHMDAAEYKHVVLGLIFLKYISDAFEEKHTALVEEKKKGADPEDKDEYLAENIFWVPKEARWPFIQGKAKQPTIGKIIDDAMVAIERDNTSLKGVLPKDFNRPALDKHLLGGLIDLIGTIGLGSKEHRSKDILGRVYEYFLSQFASAEGKKGGQFYTPRCVVGVLVGMLAPYKGRVFDPCCGSGGMFVQSEKFVEAHGGRVGDISIYGQESNPTTWKLAMMNLAIRGIEANLGSEHADSFHHNMHKDLKADYVLANPPFNMSDWGGDRLREDSRWKFGVPPASNANYAWVQHFIHHLAPNGIAGFVLANGSMSSNQSGEGEIRKNIIEADIVDCMVAMPGQLFYSTQIPVCLWFISRNKRNGKGQDGKPMRDRSGETLFIDARKLGVLYDRVHRNLTDEEIKLIADTYHAWRGDLKKKYKDIPGFCKAVKLEEIQKHGYVLTPGRYVGAEAMEEDAEPFEEKMARLTKDLEMQFAESARLEKAIRKNMKGLGGHNL
jgi:type I restriction enzyme M protein